MITLLICITSTFLGFTLGFFHARTRLMKKWRKIQAYEKENVHL
jgi:uncharacterized protein YneF (UPF0154 family)